MRPLFADVWRRDRALLYSLASRADVSSDVVQAMIDSRPVSEAQALKVLRALNALTGQSHTLNTVDINIKEKSDGAQE